MSHSFGEGYATRSDEEGFGGTYGGNQTFQKDNNDKVHENHPDYDKTQGSEAKEMQKARNQTDVMSHSFGEGYATRSDEEGFGGTYGGNQTFQKDNNDKVHENHPDYDKTHEGSEAKEKQKARNQT
ncbi:hypothetical protein F2Q70_00019037 [Brassica cretica]|uniref:Uncharacterized protein n=1 Tax=Brassica cretica TaxID=69181 RepID=A0A8S9I1I9_BRACR|nr:hypothetical protein F2Q70_00019037 [Brassica cretica]